ncbi:tail fiber assembly protein, partial [Morganella morganii]
TIAPDVDYPKWNGKKWVTDKTAKMENDIAEAGAKKQYLIAEVNTETQILQTKLALGRIKDDEKARLNAWLDYLDELEAVDVSTAPDIIWPVKPVA